MVGCSFTGDIRHSQVLTELDLGDLVRDHRALGLQLEWCVSGVPTSQDTQWRVNYDRTAILEKEIAQGIAADLSQTQVPDWSANIEEHVKQYTQQAHDVLQRWAPKRQGPAKKPIISDGIWSLRSQKRDAERRLRHTHRLINREYLAVVFVAWAGRTTPTCCLVGWRVGAVRLAATLRNAATELRLALRAAKEQFVVTLIEQLPPGASACDILRGLRPAIGTSNLRKRKGESLPQIRDGSDQICSTKEDAVNAWADYFTAMEGGERLAPEEQRTKWVDGLQCMMQEAVDMDITVCPNLVEVEQAFRRVKAGKAIGLDGIPPELCHGCPKEAARLSYTQMMKLVCHGQEDLLHKGGSLAVAFKRGDRDRCSSYRSLLISSHQGKTLHRALRQRQCGLYTAFQQAQQLGGRPKIPVSFASHIAKAFQRYQVQRGRSHGLLFLDLEEAYYRVIRPLAVGGVWSDEQVAAMAARLHLEGDVLNDLYDNLRSPDALQCAQVPKSHRHYIQAIHMDTWFKVPNQRDCTRTLAGSRPGDSFADVVFGYLWARILRRLEAELERLGFPEMFPAVSGVGITAPYVDGGEMKVLGPTWCDDLCVLFSADDARGLVTKGGTLSGILLDLCKGHGMTPNLKKNKSEMMLELRGKGAKQWRKTCFHDWNGLMPVCCSDGMAWVHIVGAYNHLGGTIQHGGDQRKEAARRLAIAHGAFSDHRRILYCNSRFDVPTRAGLFKTIVLPKAVFGMETWILTTESARSQLHSRLMRLYRRLLPEKHDAHLTDEYIIAMTELPWPSTWMRSLRLRYIGLLYKNGDLALWSVLRQDETWIELVKNDVDWMYRQLHNSSRLPPPREDFGAWEAIMKQHPGYWKRLVRRAVIHDTLQWKNAHVVDDFHKVVVQRFEEAKVMQFVYNKDSNMDDGQRGHYGCIHCKARCKTYAGEAAHMCRKHGKVNFVRSLMSGSQCGACLKHYHTTARLQRHLMHNKGCRNELWRRGVRYDIEDGIGSATMVEEENLHDGLAPVLQAEGPLPLVSTVDMPDYDGEIVEHVVAAMDDANKVGDREDYISRVVDKIEEQAFSWTELKKALRYMGGSFAEGAAMALEMEIDEYNYILETLLAPATWKCFQKEREDQQVHRDVQYWQRTVVDTHNARVDGIDPPPFVPRFGRHRILLHAYSGRRRPGDVQCFLEQSTVQPGIVLHVVSLDIIIDKHYGDILNPRIRRFWMEAAAQSWVHSFVAGPPCETWSNARAHGLQTADAKGRRGPRVIRTSECPWGLDSLGIKELQQILCGDVLLGFTITMLATLFTTGGSGLAEHPARPQDEKAASIWRTPIMEFLLQLPEVQLIKAYQGHYGAPSGKPTELFALRMPSLARHLREGTLTVKNPGGVSLGVNNMGNFKTTRLKEYPPGLCRVFARAILDSVDRVGVDSAAREPSDSFLRICKDLEATLYSATMGHDFMQLN